MSNNATIDLFGVRVELWIEHNNEWVSFRSIAGNATDYIDSISVKIGLMQNFSINVKLCPPLADAIILLNSGKLGLGFSSSDKTSSVKSSVIVGDEVKLSNKDYHMNKIAVRIHYGGRSSPFFKAVLLMPEFELSNEEGIEITMNGIGMLFEASKKPAILSGLFNKEGAIKQLLGHNKNVNIVLSPGAKELLKQEDSNFSINSGNTSMEAAINLLKSNHCYIINKGSSSLGDNETFLIMSAKEKREKNFGKFVAFKQIDPNSGIFPILNLRSPMTNLAISPLLKQIKKETYDKSKKQSIPDNIDMKKYSETAGNEIPTPDGSVAGDSSDTQSDDFGGSFFGAISKGSGFIDAIKGAAYEYMEKTFEYHIGTVCIPSILPGTMVEIDVAGIKSLSGKYDLFSVEHTISSGGAETSLDCKGMGGLAAAAGVGMNKITKKLVDTAKGSIDSNENKRNTKTPSPDKLVN